MATVPLDWGAGEHLGSFCSVWHTHLIAVAVCALVIVLLTVAGRSAGRTEPALRRSWAILALSFWLAHVIWWNWEGLDLLAGLPLHLCDFNGAWSRRSPCGRRIDGREQPSISGASPSPCRHSFSPC